MDGEEQRYKCRLCSKSFLCGRSLGGHMRSHVSSSSSALFAVEPKLGSGYGLRENPSKTWRLSSSSSSHSHDKITEEEEEEEGSWSGHGGGGECLVRVPKKKRRPRRPKAVAAASSSSSSASEDHEREDVAVSLMMLSRDAGRWGSDNPSAAIESSDKNSAISEEDNPRGSDDFKKPKIYHDVLVGEFYDEGSRKSRYQCTTCKKSFPSYQALGGHRASHKRLKGRCCGGESSFDTDTRVDPIVVVVDSAKATAGSHQCGVCGKVFGSGQALGGHKRSHLAMSTTSPTIVIEEEAVVVMPNLLDLNLPAPVDEDLNLPAAVAVDAEFNSWWRGSNLKNEAMVGMTAN